MNKEAFDFKKFLGQISGGVDTIMNPVPSAKLPFSPTSAAVGLGTMAKVLPSPVSPILAGVSAIGELAGLGANGVEGTLDTLSKKYEDGGPINNVFTGLKQPIGSLMLGGKKLLGKLKYDPTVGFPNSTPIKGMGSTSPRYPQPTVSGRPQTYASALKGGQLLMRMGNKTAEPTLDLLVKAAREYLTEKALLSKSAHELVFGASGAGKTTKAKQLSQALGLPIASLDDEPEWVPWVKANDKLVDENGLPFHLQEGHPKNTEWKQLMRTITDRSLSKKSPHIVEGTHLMVLSPEELKQHNLHIVNPPADQVVQQRLDRSTRSRAANGKAAHTPEELKRNQEFARAFYNKIQPTVREWQKYAELCSNSTIIHNSHLGKSQAD